MPIPPEFILFGLMLLGVALFHKRALEITVAGLLIIVAYEALFSAFPTGSGAEALARHLEHEWVIVTNLLLLLIGFELLCPLTFDSCGCRFIPLIIGLGHVTSLRGARDPPPSAPFFSTSR